MCRHRVASLPVVDSLGRLIGIVSQGDVLDGFTRQDAAVRRVEGVIDLRDQLTYTAGGSRMHVPWPGMAVLALAMPFSSAPFGWLGVTRPPRHRAAAP